MLKPFEKIRRFGDVIKEVRQAGVNLDVVYDIEMSYYKESGNPDDMPPKELKEKIDKGELGLKTQKGFYNY